MKAPFVSVPADRSYTAAILFQWNDGGVHRTRFDSGRGDCVGRAIAIVTGLPYNKVHRELYLRQRAYLAEEFEREQGRPPTNQERGTGELRKMENPRTGVFVGAYDPWLAELGWTYVCNGVDRLGPGIEPTEGGPRLGVDPLPAGPVLVSIWGHLCAAIDGVLHDIHTRAVGSIVLGYYRPTRSGVC